MAGRWNISSHGDYAAFAGIADRVGILTCAKIVGRIQVSVIGGPGDPFRPRRIPRFRLLPHIWHAVGAPLRQSLNLQALQAHCKCGK
jgi:hypothetical protein